MLTTSQHIKHKDVVSKKSKQEHPTTAESKEFDFLWQHIRRNPRYRKLYTDVMKSLPRRSELAEIANTRRLTKAEHEEWCAPAKAFLIATRVVCLPALLDPNIEDSGEAMRLGLEQGPNYFRTYQWQTAELKSLGPVAAWNFYGVRGCAWQSDPPKDIGKHFEDLRWQLMIAERNFNDDTVIASEQLPGPAPGALGPVLWRHSKTPLTRTAKEKQALRLEYERTKGNMRKFLEEYSLMDFVIDPSLIFHGERGISARLEQQIKQIKDLRERVGLKRDVHPPRLRDWKKHLAVYDAYQPHWENNKRKFEALQRIWRERLGFVKTFDLLGVNLSNVERPLAAELDRRGRRPVGLFKIKTMLGAIDLAKSGWDNSEEVATVDFDYDLIEAQIDDTALTTARRELPSYTAQLPQILAAWRPYFSIPPVRLPAQLDTLNGDTRRKWFKWARARIEAAYPVTTWCPTFRS